MATSVERETVRSANNGRMIAIITAAEGITQEHNKFSFLRVSGMLILAIMKTTSLTIATILSGIFSTTAQTPPAKGVAIAIVYDTSGSMSEFVPNAKGAPEAKYKIANSAFLTIVDKINAFAKTNPVEATLITFGGVQVPFGKWNPATFATWISKFDRPDGSTPLGEAIHAAGAALAGSSMAKKHIVVLTDGMSNGKLRPQEAFKGVRKAATPPQLYVVAFDVQSKDFDPLKKEGAAVLSASGKTLSTDLANLFGEKILLEAEE